MAAITEQLEQSILDLEEAIAIESPTWKEILKNILPDREVAKKALMAMGFTEIQAHAICYGHTDLESTEVRKGALDANSEIMKGIQKTKDDVKRAVNALYKESVRVGKSLASLTKETTMATASMANALATLPPQPALAAQIANDFNTRVTETLESFSSIGTELGVLGNLSLLVADTVLTVVLTPVIALIDTITLGVKAIKSIPTISA